MAQKKEIVKKGAAVEKHSRNEESILSRMKLNDNKAGMDGLDRDRINQIIYEASKGMFLDVSV